MKNLNEMVAGWEDGQPSSDLDKTVPSHPPEEAFTTKKLALLQKCDDLAEVTEHYADAYEAVLQSTGRFQPTVHQDAAGPTLSVEGKYPAAGEEVY